MWSEALGCSGHAGRQLMYSKRRRVEQRDGGAERVLLVRDSAANNDVQLCQSACDNIFNDSCIRQNDAS